MGQNVQIDRILGIPAFDLEKHLSGSISIILTPHTISHILQDRAYDSSLIFLQIDDEGFDLYIDFIFAVLHRPAYDERSSGLIDQYAVHLVHNGIMKIPLHKIFRVKLHVVSQVIKPEFIVRAVSDVAFIGRLPVLIGHAMHNNAHR